MIWFYKAGSSCFVLRIRAWNEMCHMNFFNFFSSEILLIRLNNLREKFFSKSVFKFQPPLWEQVRGAEPWPFQAALHCKNWNRKLVQVRNNGRWHFHIKAFIRCRKSNRGVSMLCSNLIGPHNMIDRRSLCPWSFKTRALYKMWHKSFTFHHPACDYNI